MWHAQIIWTIFLPRHWVSSWDRSVLAMSGKREIVLIALVLFNRVPILRIFGATNASVATIFATTLMSWKDANVNRLRFRFTSWWDISLKHINSSTKSRQSTSSLTISPWPSNSIPSSLCRRTWISERRRSLPDESLSWLDIRAKTRGKRLKKQQAS